MNDKQRGILRKLIELACNNNSENEANSAARSVCRMIKDDEFKLLDSSSHTPPFRPRREPDFSDPFVDLYESIRRSAQAAAERERKRQEELLEKLRKKREEDARKEREKKEQPRYTQKENPPKWNWGYNPSDAQRDFFASGARPSWDFDSVFYDNLRRKPNERKSEERECSKCGVKVRTFRIKDETFVCGVCQWGDYTKGKEGDV